MPDKPLPNDGDNLRGRRPNSRSSSISSGPESLVDTTDDPSKPSLNGIECVLSGNQTTNHDHSKQADSEVPAFTTITTTTEQAPSSPLDEEDEWEDAVAQLRFTSSLDDSPEQQQRHKQQPQQEDEGRSCAVLGEWIRPPAEHYWKEKAEFQQPRTVLRRLRLLTGRLLENFAFQMFIIVLILINAIFMGIATFDFVDDDPTVKAAFDTLDDVFLSIFTIELGLQLFYRSVSLFKDSWLVFDFVIVVSSWSFESIQVIRAFRSFRALRLITRVGPLRDLVKAVGAVMPRMYAIGVLLILVFYIFSVLFTELFGDLELAYPYFSGLENSLFTCMQLMTMEWANITREVMAQIWWAWIPLLVFVAITGFIVFNLIVAVICDAVSVVDRESREKEEAELKAKQKEASLLLVESTRNLFEGSQSQISCLAEDILLVHRRQQHMQHAMNALAQELVDFQRETNELLGIVDTSDDDEEELRMQEDAETDEDVEEDESSPAARGSRLSKKRNSRAPVSILRSEQRPRTTRSISFEGDVDSTSSPRRTPRTTP